MEKYGLIGYPLGHSFSQKFFTEKFAKEGRDATYSNFELENIGLLKGVLEANDELRGFNVTIPYKQQVMPMLDAISDEARAIGAVNVVKVEMKDGRKVLTGYNSDVAGFVRSIKPLLKEHHRKALILGTGGASKAVRYGLTDMLGMEVMFVSRSKREGMMTYEELTPEVMAEYEVIVNCSPVGMYPHVDECPAIPYELLTDRHLLYDLVYNPDKTLFMQRGEERGATVKNGLEMLIIQAKVAWEMWER